MVQHSVVRWDVLKAALMAELSVVIMAGRKVGWKVVVLVAWLDDDLVDPKDASLAVYSVAWSEDELVEPKDM